MSGTPGIPGVQPGEDVNVLHSARRGDYRVIYRIDDDANVVEILAIEHRADAYRQRER